MRIVWLVLLVCLAFCPGCFWRKASQPMPPQNPALIVKPDNSLFAQVVRVNATGRFVVLTFPLGKMSSPGQTLFLYRGGLKTGEVRVTSHQRDDSVVADLTAGEAQVGDEARDR